MLKGEICAFPFEIIVIHCWACDLHAAFECSVNYYNNYRGWASKSTKGGKKGKPSLTLLVCLCHLHATLSDYRWQSFSASHSQPANQVCASVCGKPRIKWLPSILQGHIRVCEQWSDVFDPVAWELEGGRGGRVGEQVWGRLLAGQMAPGSARCCCRVGTTRVSS